jgi:predicted acyltransferase
VDCDRAGARSEAIDQFRGFAILLMVLANYGWGVERLPRWLKHAPDIGLTVTDLIAPFFIFAIGLTYGLSLRRRIGRDERGRAIEHVIRRYTALLGIGAVAVAVEIALLQKRGGVNWGVLQAIGMAGLVTLPSMFLPLWARAAAGLALLGGYQVLLDRFWLQTVLHSPHGGIEGSWGWAAMLILATVAGDLFHDPSHGRRLYYPCILLMLLAGLLLSPEVPVSKARVSASYVLISVGAGGILFAAFVLLTDRLGVRLPVLSAWGKNPLLLYVLHLLLLGAFQLSATPRWYKQAPLWLAALEALVLIAVLSRIGSYLARRNWVFAL